MEIRLSKIMADRGICSRRKADELIESGMVYVNGEKVVKLGAKFTKDINITIDPAAQLILQKLVTILLHKPIGYVSQAPEPGKTPAIRLIKSENQFDKKQGKKLEKQHLDKLAVAGRLDLDSEGLLVFTQDGVTAKMLIGDNSAVDKEYVVDVSGTITPEKIAQLQHGLKLDGKALRPVVVTQVSNQSLNLVLREGRNRQIRRMCAMVGLSVVKLVRVRIGKVSLGNLPPGKWRFLTDGENF